MTPAQFKERRLAMGLTQRSLAQALGMNEDWIGKMERGERPIRKLVQLALDALPRPKTNVKPAPSGRNRQQGAPSRSFGSSVRLPVLTMQACGHVFNSAGCLVCPVCERRPPIICATPEEWRAIERRNLDVVSENIVRSISRWATRLGDEHVERVAIRAGADQGDA